jgi:hypothetical protein
MKLLTHCSLLLLLFIFAGCSKPGQPGNPVVSKETLLTQKPWILFSYGVDRNNNGITDPSEEVIASCEKDNTYSFALDGSGTMSDNAERCPGTNATSSFEWSFSNNKTEIDFVYGIAVLLKLTGDSMMLGEKSTESLKLIFNYKH